MPWKMSCCCDANVSPFGAGNKKGRRSDLYGHQNFLIFIRGLLATLIVEAE
jgi:hypothetical protein